jgi:ppGpp synthetase/RelA/SpoT-type nucleotidyltranferase
MNVLDEFVERYRRELDYYQEVARLAAQQVEGLLEAAGIRAIVTYRAKRIDSLSKKIHARHRTKHYDSVAKIQSDVVDLAGVRIALYFPADRTEVEKLVRTQFDLAAEPKVFPTDESLAYKKRFEGYRATHYRVRLRAGNLPVGQARYTEAAIEIQVASVLMHAWAEVEHDLMYKPTSGNLSEDEYAILDELNGMVLAGEIALERLQRAVQTRVSVPEVIFRNHYELAAYLFEAARKKQLGPEEPVMGRADLLFRLLSEADLRKPSELDPYVSSLKEATEERPLAEQIIDLLVSSNPDLYRRYGKLRGEWRDSMVGLATEPAEAEPAGVGEFLAAWVQLERTVRRKGEAREQTGPIPFNQLAKMIRLSDHDFGELRQLQQLRNRVVHGLEAPPPEYLRDATQRVRALTRKLAKRK